MSEHHVTAILAEFVATLLFTLVILGSTSGKGATPFPGLVIGLTLGPAFPVHQRDRPVGQSGTQSRARRVHRRPGAGAGLAAGSRLKPLIIGKVPLGKPAFQPYWGKPAVRNDRGDRGNVGIIRSPIRASILPDFHYRTSEMRAKFLAAGTRVRTQWEFSIFDSDQQKARVDQMNCHQ
jgi:hypothetical protein